MNLIERIRLFFYHRSLHKKMQQHKRPQKPMRLEAARSIGILFDATSLESQKTAQQYAQSLQDKGKNVRLLGFLNSRQKDENFAFRHFNKRDINWMLCPKGPEVTDFMQQPFDILFVLSYQSNLQFEYIASLSKASFRVGPYTEHTYSYDLMLDTSAQDDLNPFIQQAELFLNKMHSSHEAPAA